MTGNKRKRIFSATLAVTLFLLPILWFGVVRAQSDADKTPSSDPNILKDRIEQLTGAKATYIPEEQVYRVNLPRSDPKVIVAGSTVTPPMGLTAWAAFKATGAPGSKDSTMVMGDMVLTEEQMNPVMDVALTNGLQVTGLHNHFLWDNPRIMFMHIAGSGDTEKMATVVGMIFSKMREKGTAGKPHTEINPANTNLDTKKIDAILNQKGQMQDGVYKVTIGRTTTMNGQQIGNAMGVNTWAGFAGTDKQAVVDGDFAMLETELQPVLKALRSSGINIVAIHNHMIMDQPRIMFLHFWGIGSSTDLATGLKKALDTQTYPKG
jgi:hypothetical protein